MRKWIPTLFVIASPLSLFPSCYGESSIIDGTEPPPACEKLPECNGGAGGDGGSGGEDPADDACDASELLQFSRIEVPGYEDAADFRFIPHSHRILIAERRGVLRELDLSRGELEELRRAELPDEVKNSEACGVTNLLVDPEFEDNGYVYLSYCPRGAITRLSRVTFTNRGLEDLQVILETELKRDKDGWHRFGSMDFEEDGKTLWFLSGDQTERKEAQDLTSLRGKLLRIRPSRKAGQGGYAIPPGNMAEELGAGGARSEDVDPAIYAYGFRSPWRAARDELGRIFVGDVGDTYAEEVNLVEQVGQNFGWGDHEGPCTENCAGSRDPVAWYTRSVEHPYVFDDPSTEPATKRAIWVGEIYPSQPEVDRYCGRLRGVTIFGDFFTGWVRGVAVNARGEVTSNRQLGHLPRVTSWRRGPGGYLYALTLDGGLSRVELALPTE